MAIAAEPTLSLSEALAIATRDSSLLSAQRSAIAAAQESTVTARELPDPKLRLPSNRGHAQIGSLLQAINEL